MNLKFCNLQTHPKVLLPGELGEPLRCVLPVMQIESTNDFGHIYIDTSSFHTHWVGYSFTAELNNETVEEYKSKY